MKKTFSVRGSGTCSAQNNPVKNSENSLKLVFSRVMVEFQSNPTMKWDGFSCDSRGQGKERHFVEVSGGKRGPWCHPTMPSPGMWSQLDSPPGCQEEVSLSELFHQAV